MQAEHTPQGVGVIPVSQLSALARMRAIVVLPTPAGAGKQISMVQPFLLKGIGQRPDDVLLPDQFVEAAWDAICGREPDSATRYLKWKRMINTGRA